MEKLLNSNQKVVTAMSKSAGAEFAHHLCDVVKKFIKMPDDFNPRYVPHKKIAAANELAKRVEAKLKTDNMIVPSDLRGLYRHVVRVCG